MLEFDSRKIMNAASAVTATADRTAIPADRPRKLSPAALKVAAQPTAAAYSPIVLAGAVRMIELALVALVGLAIYVAYVVPHGRLRVALLRRPSPGVAVLAMLAFQIADIYQVQAFRGHEKQYFRLASAWSVVFLIAIGVVVLRQGRRSVLARLARQLLRRRAGGAARLSAARCSCWCGAGRARAGSTAAPSIVGGGDRGEALIEALRAAARLRRPHGRRVRRPRRRPLAGDDRRPPQARHRRRAGRVRAPHPRRPGDLLAADLGRGPHPADAQEALGAAGRHPAVGAFEQAALPPARLFVYRQRAGARRVRPADHRLGRGDEMAVRQGRRQPGAARAVAADAAHRDRHQARQPGPGVLQAEAPRLQQRADRGLQVPLDVRRADATPPPPSWSTKDDPRVTRVGRFIRKTRIDELPQLFNVVFKGNLSLVGPRPHAVHAKAENRLYDEAVDGYFARHRVKPGITGWAQINGWRGETDTHEKIQRRVEHDLYYIENWSMLFDLYILVMTPLALAQDRERLLMIARIARQRRPDPRPGRASPPSGCAALLLWLMAFSRRLRVHRAQPLRGRRAPHDPRVRPHRPVGAARADAARCCCSFSSISATPWRCCR